MEILINWIVGLQDVLTKPLHLNKFYSRRGPLVILHFLLLRIFHLFNPHRDRYLITL